jgi:RNase_H superfamily
MKLLTLDIEAAPAQVVTWDLKADWINPGNILKSRRLLCMASKWYGDPEITFLSEWGDGREEMIQRAWHLLDEADGVIGYNSQGYDMPMLATEFILAGMPPPSPYVNIDLMRTVKRRFRMMSNSLDYLTGQLGVGRKGDSGGMKTWLAVENGDERARKVMEEYNKLDVEITEQLYCKLLPWIPNHPSRAIVDQDEGCPSCGGLLRPRGFTYTKTRRYRRFRCDDCQGWSRSTHCEDTVAIAGI